MPARFNLGIEGRTQSFNRGPFPACAFLLCQLPPGRFRVHGVPLSSRPLPRTAAPGWKPYLLVAPSVLMVLLFVCVPVLSALWHSFFVWHGHATHGFVGLGNYARVLGDGNFWASVGTGLALVVANVLKLGVTIGLAVALHRLRGSRWQPLYLALLVLPLLVPGLVTLLVWKQFLASRGGLLNGLLEFTHFKSLFVWLFPGSFHAGQPADWLREPALHLPSLILWGFPWVSAAGVLLFLAVLRQLGSGVYEAAKLDCVTPWQVFRHVELPLLVSRGWPAAALTAVGTLQGFGLQFLFLVGAPGAGSGVTPGLWMLYPAFVLQDFGTSCAVGVMLLAVLLAGYFLLRRFLQPPLLSRITPS